MTMAPVVRARHLNHFFGDGDARKQVLFDMGLEVMSGEIVIMTGPSGSGKTTLLTLIGALRSVQEGELDVFGRALQGAGHSALVQMRRNIGFIFQAHNLFESLTAYQNVRMALELGGHPEQEIHRRATEMLRRVGLGNRMDYKPHALSGGQKQRVAAARALVTRPALVLADEPTAALDKDAGRDVVDLLRSLASEERTAILIVTHDNRILDVADRIVNMVDGRIVSDVAVESSVMICEFLSKCSLFAGLTPATLSGIADKMRRETCPAGTVVLRQGDEGEKFYLIAGGSVDVFVDGGTTEPLVTRVKGEVIGEAALITGGSRNATVVAKEACEFYTLGKDDFTAALAASATFKEQLLNVFFQRQGG
jgi:putative ABC transport system ATP-binding protein